MMRVTHRMVVDRVIRNVQRNVARLEELQQQIGSGKRVGRPADDPVATALAMRLRARQEQHGQYLRNIKSGRLWLQLSESALAHLTDSLQRARELAVQAGTDTMNSDDRHAIAQEIDQLMENAAQLANTTVDVDQHVFAGFQTMKSPFVAKLDEQTFEYQGDSGPVERQIGPDTRIQINTPGNIAFTPAINALKKLRDTLNSSTTTGNDVVATINDLDTAVDTVLLTRTEVGARLNQLDDAEQQLSERQLSVARSLSDQEDLDFADALTNLALQEAAYKASLQSGARAILPSLLDWLR